MKTLLKIALFCLFASAAWGQCGTVALNPLTNSIDCIGKNGQGKPNITASSSGAVTSRTLNTASLNVADTTTMLVQCWTGTSTFAPVAITSLDPVTVSGGVVTVVTPNFSSTANVYCTASANSGTGPAGGPGVTGAAGANGAGNNTFCSDATGSTTTYTCPTPTPAISTLTGLIVSFVPQTTNTGSSTLNVSGLGDKSLLQSDGVTNITSGALVGGSTYAFSYNGTAFVQTSSGTTFLTTANHTWTGTQDFTGATALLCTSASANSTTAGYLCYDTTLNQWRAAENGVNYGVPTFVGSFTDSDLVLYNGATKGLKSGGPATNGISGQTTGCVLKANAATTANASANLCQDTAGDDYFTKAFGLAPANAVTYTNAGTTTIDLSVSNFNSITIPDSGTTTIAVSNPPTGSGWGVLKFVQAATTAGSVTAPASFQGFFAPSPGLSSKCFELYFYDSLDSKYQFLSMTCTDAAGVVQVSETAAPTTATYCGAGKLCLYGDSTDHQPEAKQNNSSNVYFMPLKGADLSLLGQVTQVHDKLTTVNNAASPYTVLAADTQILCDATAGTVTINLPAATGTGRELSIKKTDSSANACTPTRAGSDTIDGATSYSLTVQYAASKITDTASAVWSRVHVNQVGGDLTGISTNVTVAKVNGQTPGGTCTNQFARTIDSSGRPTCATVANADLANPSTTVNGQTCTLGSSCTIPLSAVNPQTATYQVLAGDFSNYKTITVASGTFTITLVASGSQPAAGQYITVINYGSGTVTIARSGQNINGGVSSVTLGAASATAPLSLNIFSDGTNYFASGIAGGGSGSGSFTMADPSTTIWMSDYFLGGTTICGGGNGDNPGLGYFNCTGANNTVTYVDGVGLQCAYTSTAASDCILTTRQNFLNPATMTFDLKFRLNLSSITNVQLFAGLVQTGNGRFTGIRFDTSASDTHWMYYRNNGSVTTSDSGTAPVAGTFVDFRIRSTVAGTLLFSLNGGSETSISTGIQNALNAVEIKLVNVTTGQATNFQLGYTSMLVTGLSQ